MDDHDIPPDTEGAMLDVAILLLLAIILGLVMTR
jgi:hypothetical protein